MAKEDKIAKEVAEKDFLEWCEQNELDCDTSAMDDEAEKDFNDIKNRIVKAVCAGRCVFVDSEVKYTISKRTQMPDEQREVLIKRPNGYTYAAIDGIKKGYDMKKTYAMLSQMTSLPDGLFRKMDILDLNFFQAVFQLFLAE